MRGRKRLTASLLLGATLGVACAGTAYRPLAHATAYCPVAGDSCGEQRPEATLDARFRPIKLPKTKLAPIHLKFSGRVDMPVGSHPSPLEEVVLETDRSMAIAARGLPVCRLMIDVPDPCRDARVGKGEMEVEVELPETQPFALEGHVDAFNRGVKDGVKTIAAVTYLPSPLSAGVVIWFKVSKVRQGRYGARWVATIPKIAGGFGWVKSFDLTLFRRFGYKGKKRSYLLARCADGKLQMRWKAKFAGGTTFNGASRSPCTPIG